MTHNSWSQALPETSQGLSTIIFGEHSLFIWGVSRLQGSAAAPRPKLTQRSQRTLRYVGFPGIPSTLGDPSLCDFLYFPYKWGRVILSKKFQDTKKKYHKRRDRRLVIYFSYFQATVTKVFNFYNTLDKKIKFK